MDHAELFDVQVVLFGGEPDHLQDVEHIILSELGFGTLAGIEDIFEKKRVDPEYFADPPDQFGIVQSVDVQPEPAVLLQQFRNLIRAPQRNPPDFLLVVAESLQRNVLHFTLAGENQRTGHHAGFSGFGSDVKILHISPPISI